MKEIERLIVRAPLGETVGTLTADGQMFKCALGRSGLVPDKREGDGGTPVGVFPLRKLYYRADSEPEISTILRSYPIKPGQYWCDDPSDSIHYNQFINNEISARTEKMWRDDHLYDLVVTLGYNDNPPIPGLGSAIFFHLAHEDYRPTEGCVAIARSDMKALLPRLSARTVIDIAESRSTN